MPFAESGHNQLLAGSPNLLLRSLEGEDARLLRPHLRRIELRCGDVVVDPATVLYRAIFPETAIVSFRAGIGAGPETAMVGSEGIIGWSLLLGAERVGLTGVVQFGAGSALAIGAQQLRGACGASPTLRIALLAFVETLTLQMAGTIASMPESVEKRLARWLLMIHDRQAEDALGVTHDHIASALYVRRASVTDCLHLIEGEGIVRCTRGRIVIRDRQRLEALAGNAYVAARHGRQPVSMVARAQR